MVNLLAKVKSGGGAVGKMHVASVKKFADIDFPNTGMCNFRTSILLKPVESYGTFWTLMCVRVLVSHEVI